MREIAERVAKKFNNGSYKCLGHLIKCSAPTNSEFSGNRSSNRVPWTIVLSSVPGRATYGDVIDSIISVYDGPRHVELGAVSYHASEPEISIAVRSCLEKHGPLESFTLIPTPQGKRAKATASFQDEADARAAAMLDNTELSLLGRGKLTVTLIQSVKIKVPTQVYFVSKSMIQEKINLWTQQHLTFHAYTEPERPLETLKVEGRSAKDVANACRALHDIMSGVILVNDGEALWSPAFGTNGTAYRELMSIAKNLGVVVQREKLRQQLRYYGPANKMQQSVTQISNMLSGASSLHYQLDLNPLQFCWAIHGGFKRIQQVLPKDVAVFDVVSRRIAINGTSQDYDIALAAMDSRACTQINAHSGVNSGAQLESRGDCPICFCEADNPIQISCKHTYCLECFEGYCQSATPSSQEKFQIKCCGSEGECPTILTLKELKSHLPSSVFEQVLEKSFEEYVKRRPDDFRSCPTPDCGHIYRSSKDQSLESRTYTCPSCFEQLCTFYHAQHGDYTCAEYKDIASGGVEALERLKKELNIKDCPRCRTSIEKTEGCNHMTCGGCKAHICWVCMHVFDSSGPCYEHMNEAHGGIGLGLERFMV
ncbi:MAG: hypothetical protein Q9182_002786 [Xanthomendoza sp. 2 TL-2023]